MSRPLDRPVVLDGVEYIVINDGAGHYLQLPKLTTAQRDALSAVEGMMIYNSDTGVIEAYQNGSWGTVGGASALGDLTDVTISSPADNEILAYDAGSGEWINQTAAEAGLAEAGHTHNLSDLADTTISSPGDNELLAYDSGSGKWVNQTAAEAGLVTGPSGTDGQIQYNDGGSFGGASGLYWDDANSRLGMHSSSPQTDVVIGAGKEFAIEMQAPQNVTATTSEGGTLDGTYYYKVSAGDGTGWTVLSSEVSATVDGGATAGTITISWDAVPGASVYRVWRGTSSGGQNEYYETSSTSLADDGSLTFTAGTPPSVTDAYVLYVDSSGNVGIGTAAPGRDLVVSSASNTKILIESTATNSYPGFILATPSDSWRFEAQDAANRFTIKEDSTGEMFIIYKGAPAGSLVLDASGQLGIGTTSPSHLLHIAGDIRIDGTTSTTATAGSASLPSNPVGFLTVNIGGTDYKIPYYDV